jgi:hypothetical protein
MTWCGAFMTVIAGLALIATGFTFIWEHDGR